MYTEHNMESEDNYSYGLELSWPEPSRYKSRFEFEEELIEVAREWIH